MFAKEGFYIVIPSFIVNTFVIILFNYLFNNWFPLFGWFFSPLFILTAFFTFFFRNPPRTPEGDGILAPTDGTIMSIKSEGNKLEMFIELAASDVHTQRAPSDGKILSVERIKGSHHPIYFINKGEINSEYIVPANKNARINIEMIDSDGLPMKIILIAGIFARRCKAYVKPGVEVKRGQNIGIIMFGSLLKFELVGKFKIIKKVGDHVKAGKHVILKKV
ncbi:MAG: phosphatidylserine decarboxylase [Candidatus Helarchaeota archaeon]